MASRTFNLAKTAFGKLRALYPGISKHVNTGADAVPAVMVAEFARALMDVNGNIIFSADAGGFIASQGIGGAVTQITSSSTAVTLNKLAGAITTVALTTTAGAEEVFTVNDTLIGANDTINFGTTYAGAGTPAITSKKIVAGTSFDIVITNLHASAALNAAMVINYTITRGSVN